MEKLKKERYQKIYTVVDIYLSVANGKEKED